MKSKYTAPDNDARYFVSGRLTIAGNLSLEAMAAFEMAEDVFWIIDGSFGVNGTAKSPVILTTANEAAQINWGGIFVQSANALNSIDHAEVRLAGGAEIGFGPINTRRQAATGVDTNYRLSLTNTTVADTEGFGVFSLGITGDIQATEAGNTFINNLLGNSFTP